MSRLTLLEKFFALLRAASRALKVASLVQTPDQDALPTAQKARLLASNLYHLLASEVSRSGDIISTAPSSVEIGVLV